MLAKISSQSGTKNGGISIVFSDNKLNGIVLDYAFKDEKAMIYEFGDIECAAL